MSPSKKQRRKAKREREQAAYAIALAAVKATGATCSTCVNYIRAHSISKTARACELDSDSDGYVIVRPDFVCTRHATKVLIGK